MSETAEEIVTHDFHDSKGPVPARQHKNGGGWVALTADVASGVHVGPEATVYGLAIAYGEAQILDEARVHGRAVINEKAMISGKVHVYGEARVSGKATVRDEARVSGKAMICDEATVCDKAKVHGEYEVVICGNLTVSGRGAITTLAAPV